MKKSPSTKVKLAVQQIPLTASELAEVLNLARLFNQTVPDFVAQAVREKLGDDSTRAAWSKLENAKDAAFGFMELMVRTLEGEMGSDEYSGKIVCGVQAVMWRVQKDLEQEFDQAQDCWQRRKKIAEVAA